MIRIAILIDGDFVSKWINDLLQKLSSDHRFEIVLLISNASSKTKAEPVKLVYRFLRKVDRLLMELSDSPLQKVKICLDSLPVLEVKPLQGVFTDIFPDETIKSIKEYKPDILLRFGFRILKGDILTVAPYGVISLHHGDTDTNRGGPPAFWEVVNQDPVTAVTVQQLTEQLDGGRILAKAFTRTYFYSFIRNQQLLYAEGKQLLWQVLDDIANQGIVAYFERPLKFSNKWYDCHLFKDPGNITSFRIGCIYIFRLFKEKISQYFCNDQWQILYAKEKGEPGTRPFYQYKQLVPPVDRIWADPFLLYKDHVYHLFFEEKRFKEQNGWISLLRFSEKGILLDEQPIQVLKESWHLSYPFIFEFQDEIYMIPESGSIGVTNLYKAESFPYKWTVVKRILEGVQLYDSTLHFKDGYWWLFGTVKQEQWLSADACLHIYFTKDLLNEPFQPHSLNPIYRDVRKSRPAGKMFIQNGELIRPVQVGAPFYGSEIVMNRITVLSTEAFAEEPIARIQPKWLKRQRAVHTWNHEKGLSVVDVQVKRFSFL